MGMSTPSPAARAQGLSMSLIRQVFDAAQRGHQPRPRSARHRPPPPVMDRLAQAARDNMAAYTPNAGDTELRDRVGAELFDGAPWSR